MTHSRASAVKSGKLLARRRQKSTESSHRLAKNETAHKKKSRPVRCIVWSSLQGGPGRATQAILRQAQVREDRMDHTRLRISAGLCHSGWGNERQQYCAD